MEFGLVRAVYFARVQHFAEPRSRLMMSSNKSPLNSSLWKVVHDGTPCLVHMLLKRRIGRVKTCVETCVQGRNAFVHDD